MGTFFDWLKSLFAAKPQAWRPTEFVVCGDIVANLCNSARDHVYLWDMSYYALSMADWKKVFADVLKDMPKYLVDKFDCEDYAFLTMSRVTERYEINTCGVAVGTIPQGAHGFNLFIAKEGDVFKLHILEPQTGQIDPAGYEFDTVIFS